MAKPVEAVLDDTAIGDEDVAATVSASLWSTLDARGAFVVVAPPGGARRPGTAVLFNVGGPAVRETSARSSTARARGREAALRVRRARERVALSNGRKKTRRQKSLRKPLTSAASSSSAAARNQRIWRAARRRARRRAVGGVGGRGVGARRGVRRGLRDVRRGSTGSAGGRGETAYASAGDRKDARGSSAMCVEETRCRVRNAKSRKASRGAERRRRVDDDDDELKKSPLPTYPGFEPVTMYDEDDLDTASIFVLLAPTRARATGKRRPGSASARAFVWVGGGSRRRPTARGRARDVRGAVCRECRERRERVRGVLGSLRGGTGVK